MPPFAPLTFNKKRIIMESIRRINSACTEGIQRLRRLSASPRLSNAQRSVVSAKISQHDARIADIKKRARQRIKVYRSEHPYSGAGFATNSVPFPVFPDTLRRKHAVTVDKKANARRMWVNNNDVKIGDDAPISGKAALRIYTDPYWRGKLPKPGSKKNWNKRRSGAQRRKGVMGPNVQTTRQYRVHPDDIVALDPEGRIPAGREVVFNHYPNRLQRARARDPLALRQDAQDANSAIRRRRTSTKAVKLKKQNRRKRIAKKRKEDIREFLESCYELLERPPLAAIYRRGF